MYIAHFQGLQHTPTLTNKQTGESEREPLGSSMKRMGWRVSGKSSPIYNTHIQGLQHTHAHTQQGEVKEGRQGPRERDGMANERNKDKEPSALRLFPSTRGLVGDGGDRRRERERSQEASRSRPPPPLSRGRSVSRRPSVFRGGEESRERSSQAVTAPSDLQVTSFVLLMSPLAPLLLRCLLPARLLAFWFRCSAGE